MLFNSIEYIILLLVSLCGYWVTQNLRLRQYLLFFASIYFYMSWSKTFIFLLLATVAVNWFIGFRLHRSGRAIWLYIAVALNLLILSFFKYINFFTENVYRLIGFAAELPSDQVPYLNIVLPLGISFYTFEVISYLIDIHRKKTEPEQDFISFALFVLFFPHLIAGPICRKNQFIPQVKTLQVLNLELLVRGGLVFLAGFVLKTSIADGISPYVNVIFAKPEEYSGFDNMVGSIAFGIQIFCDFWGYSLMAIGAALLFGITLPSNFNAPYIATSIQDFWRRWHITLSNWLRDYLYISMGGSRVNDQAIIYRNLMITMLLGGLWHGASWNFIAWGGIHGVALIVNRIWQRAEVPGLLRFVVSNRLCSWVITMIIVFAAWIFFRAQTMDAALGMIRAICSAESGWSSTKLNGNIFELFVLFWVLHWIIQKVVNCNNIKEISDFRFLVTSTFLIFVGFVYYVDGSEFIYFQF